MSTHSTWVTERMLREDCDAMCKHADYLSKHA